jgi:hypothetical protein
MRMQIGILGLAASLSLGGCAHRASGGGNTASDNGSSPVDGDVPSTRRGIILPSDPAMGVAGAKPTSGTQGGHIDNSLGKGAVGSSPP